MSSAWIRKCPLLPTIWEDLSTDVTRTLRLGRTKALVRQSMKLLGSQSGRAMLPQSHSGATVIEKVSCYIPQRPASTLHFAYSSRASCQSALEASILAADSFTKANPLRVFARSSVAFSPSCR